MNPGQEARRLDERPDRKPTSAARGRNGASFDSAQSFHVARARGRQPDGPVAAENKASVVGDLESRGRAAEVAVHFQVRGSWTGCLARTPSPLTFPSHIHAQKSSNTHFLPHCELSHQGEWMGEDTISWMKYLATGWAQIS